MRQFQYIPTTYVFSIDEYFTVSFFVKTNFQPLSFIQRNEHVEMNNYHVVSHAPGSQLYTVYFMLVTAYLEVFHGSIFAWL